VILYSYLYFLKSVSETLFGHVEIKTKSVHFFVQTGNSFSTENTIISFVTEQLNVGGAMNSATGVFTIPVNGIYHFEFFGLKNEDPVPIYVFLQVNGVNIAPSYATYLSNALSLSGISASLQLKTGDKVRLFKTSGALDGGPFTHFTGWLVEEDLAMEP